MIKYLACCLVLCVSSVNALEYLTDEELASIDGYTSSRMLKEYDAEGNTIFRRGDEPICRDDSAGPDCDLSLDGEYDKQLERSFQRYLEQALVLMEGDPRFDAAGDQVLEIELSAFLDDFDYNHLMCDGMPDGGVIRLEGVSLKNADGSNALIQSKVSLVNNPAIAGGRMGSSIMLEARASGELSIDAIRIGRNVSEAEASRKSIGRVRATLSDSTIKLSQSGD